VLIHSSDPSALHTEEGAQGRARGTRARNRVGPRREL